MKLSEITYGNPIFVKEGYFENLGHCSVQKVNNILTFLDDIKFIEDINSNKNLSGVICKVEHIDKIKNPQLGIICVEEPKLYFFELHNYLFENIKSHSNFKSLIAKNSLISKSAIIADSNVEIGSNVTIEENVIIRGNVKIGNNSIIRTGSVIGGEGFEFKRNKKSRSILRVAHKGKIIIGENVEMKEFCTVHQAVFDWDVTSIGEYSKIDAHTHIGHATKIGKRVMIGSHGNLSGNIIINDDVNIGPGVTISNRLMLKEQSKVSIGSVVTQDVDINTTVTGNFAISHSNFINHIKNISKNPIN